MSYQQVATGQVNPEVPINENMDALGQGFVFSHNVVADTGLVVGINGGNFDGNTVADMTVACTDSATNYIVAHRTTRAITTATTTTSWNNITVYGRVARAVFAAGVLTFHDERSSAGGIFDHGSGAAILADGDYGDIVVSAAGSAINIDSGVLTTFGRTVTGAASASAARTMLGLGTSATLDVDTDTAMAANSDTRIPSQKAVAAYIASFMSNFDTKPECAYASTSALPANTYNNGTSGVGATLTGNVNGPLLIDGVTLVAGAVGDRILVGGEGTDSHNGWFTLTQLGVVALSPYILTRDVLSDQAAEIAPGYLTAIKAPSGLTAGSSNDGKLFISVCPSPFTVGTSALTFTAIGTASGSVTTVSVVTANGVSGSVANPSTTPAITLTLGAITPTSVAASGAVSGSNLSGTNTGDQTLSDATISTTDITTNNVSTTKHGFAPKAPNDATKFLDGTGAYSEPAGATFTGGTLTSALNEAPPVTIASAATVNIGAAAGNTINVTGTTTITAFDTIASGALRCVIFGGVLTLTHNATSLILPGSANITTAANDCAFFESKGSGNWICVGYQKASGAALVSSGGVAVDAQTFNSNGTWTKPAGVTLVEVVVIGGGGGGGGGAGQANGTRRDGGGGGGGGAMCRRIFKASDLGGTETITVGAAGTAGTGGSTANGVIGVAGGNSSFGSWLTAYGGGAGGAGTSVSVSGGGGGGSAGAGANGSGANVAGGLPASTAAANGLGGQGGGATAFSNSQHAEYGGGGGGGDNGAGGASMYGGGGGGGGGTLSSSQIQFAPGYGGATTGVYAASSSGSPNNAGTSSAATTGVNGGNGGAGDSTKCGAGGGGGGLNLSGTGGTGGTGGAPGGGGGGGGCGTSVGGPGGVGAAGQVRVYSW